MAVTIRCQTKMPGIFHRIACLLHRAKGQTADQRLLRSSVDFFQQLLQIHRIIKDSLRGRLGEKRIGHYTQILPEVAKHASEMERRADEAERETIKLKKVQYMENHIGETFAGVISGVAEYGFFVELENTVEGLVRVTSLTDDFYQYYEETYELVGEATNRRFKLGQQVRVTVDNCDRIMRTIDFTLADSDEN